MMATPYRRPSLRLAKAKEFGKTIGFFMATQAFFAAMILGFSYGGEILFGAILGIPPTLAFMAGGKKAHLFILYFIAVAFAVGQRTIYIGRYIRLVPAEILVWGLALLSLSILSRHFFKTKPFTWVFIIFNTFVFLYIPLSEGIFDRNANLSIMYAKMMLMSVPFFFVIWKYITRTEQLRSIVIILTLEAFFLSFLALSEYFNLGYIKYFGAFLDEKAYISQEGFKRLGASFWGGPALAMFLAMIVPLSTAQLSISKTWIQRFLVGASLVLALAVIYFSGHRGVWIALMAGMLVYFMLNGAKGLVILALVIGVGVSLIPEEGKTRLESLYGEHRDTSSKKREDRAKEAWQMMIHNPIGSGYGASGLVHSDMIQLGADTGIPTMILWISIYGQIVLRLLRSRKIRDSNLRQYVHALFGSIIVIFLMLWTQAFFNLPEQYVLIWFVTALAYHVPNVIQTEKIIALRQQETMRNA